MLEAVRLVREQDGDDEAIQALAEGLRKNPSLKACQALLEDQVNKDKLENQVELDLQALGVLLDLLDLREPRVRLACVVNLVREERGDHQDQQEDWDQLVCLVNLEIEDCQDPLGQQVRYNPVWVQQIKFD